MVDKPGDIPSNSPLYKAAGEIKFPKIEVPDALEAKMDELNKTMNEGSLKMASKIEQFNMPELAEFKNPTNEHLKEIVKYNKALFEQVKHLTSDRDNERDERKKADKKASKWTKASFIVAVAAIIEGIIIAALATN